MKELIKIESRCKSDLYKKDLYTTERDYVLSRKIIEYDMREAGYSLIKYYGLLDKPRMQYLESLSKTDRKIQIGIYMRDDKVFNKELTGSFKAMRKKFFIDNKLVDDDVISIKKDAIFVARQCKQTKYGSVEFAEKNVYSSFHKFGNIELYFNNKTNALDVKGINNDLLYKHEKFMSILKRLFRYIDLNEYDEMIKFIKKFVDDYKNKRLEYSYYREFNQTSAYLLDIPFGDRIIGTDSIDPTIDENLDISYNYITYILPIIQRFYFK